VDWNGSTDFFKSLEDFGIDIEAQSRHFCI
jgi:hypothetical protein